jgi:hypothetical protein
VLVYPAHGSGSLCGSQIRQQPYSTIGYEKKTNPYLTIDRETFNANGSWLNSCLFPHTSQKWNSTT